MVDGTGDADAVVAVAVAVVADAAVEHSDAVVAVVVAAAAGVGNKQPAGVYNQWRTFPSQGSSFGSPSCCLATDDRDLLGYCYCYRPEHGAVVAATTMGKLPFPGLQH